MINMTAREKLLLKILLGILGAAALYFLIILPVISLKTETESQFNTGISKLSRLDAIYEQYNEIRHKKNRYDQMLNQSGGITALIEEHARSTNIAQNISYTRENPGSSQSKFKVSSTEVKFEGIDIGSIITFLHKIENSNRLLKISYLRINQALKAGDRYDVILKIDSLSSQ